MNMPDPAAHLHPRPQLARRNWIDLQGDWEFAYDDDDRGVTERWPQRADVFTRAIRVPFPPESPASGIGDTSFHAVVWYRTACRIQPPPDKRVILHFGAVDYRATVWVDGGLVVTHEGGHAPFSTDITAALADAGEHVIVVRAEDDPHDLSQPRGKQDWLEEPHEVWYQRTTGIWQPVWIEIVDPVHIIEARWTADVPRRALNLKISLSRGSPTPLRLRIQVRVKDQQLVDDICGIQGDTLEREIVLPRQVGGPAGDLLLWSPEQPTLIEVTLTLIRGDDIVDEVLSYAGLRSVAVKDGRFLLNGRPCFLRLVLAQGYWPESHLAAPDEHALRREVEWIRELGFNGARLHQKAEDPRFLYWCDRLGVLVWGEMASAYEFSARAQKRYLAEWQEILQRDVSHPCIISWVPFNESWGVPDIAEVSAQQQYVRAVYHLTKMFDSTRPVVGNDGWEHVIGDVLTIHDYSFHGATLHDRYADRAAMEATIRFAQPQDHALLLDGFDRTGAPIVVSEYGGISYRPDAGAAWFGYGTVTDEDAYTAKYAELTQALLDSTVLAGFCYTQLTDTRQETNGLLTETRQPKFETALLRAITSGCAAQVRDSR